MRAQMYVSDRLLHHTRQRFGQNVVDSSLNLICQLLIHYFGSCNELQFLAGLSKHPNHFTKSTSSSSPIPDHHQAELSRCDVNSCLYDVFGRNIGPDLPFIPTSTHNALLTELGFLQPEYDALLSQHHEIWTVHTKLKADHETLLSEFNDLRRTHIQLKSDYTTLDQGVDETQSDYATLQMAHKVLQLKCDELESDCKALSKALRKNGNTALASDCHDTVAEEKRVATLLKEIEAARTDWKNLCFDGRIVLDNFNRAQAILRALSLSSPISL
jgi:hypothetical protein